jgi:hypothetical protein
MRMQKKQQTFHSNNNGVYKMSKKSVWIICGIILGLLCVLMTVAAFYDYQID